MIRNKIQKYLLGLFLLLILTNVFADAPPVPPAQPDFNTTSVTYVCTSIGDLLSLPLAELQSFISANGMAAKLAYSIFAALFILETMWMVIKAYVQSHHHAGQNIASIIILRIISGSFLLMFVNRAVGREVNSIGAVSGTGQANGLVTDIFEFFMTIGNDIGGPGRGSVKLFTNGAIKGGDYKNIITDTLMKPVGVLCDSYLSKYFELAKGLRGDHFGFVGALYKLFAIIAVIIAIVFVTKIAWGLVFKIAEMIIVTYATVFMVGFVGSQWTKSYFDRYLGYIIALGIEFFLTAVILNFILDKMLGINNKIDTIDLWGPIKLVFNTIISYQFMALAPKIAASISSGTPQVSTGDSAATMAGIAGGAVSAGVGAIGAAGGAVNTAGGMAKAGAQIASGAMGGAAQGGIAASLGGGSSFMGSVMGGAKGAMDAVTKSGGASDTMKSTSLGGAMKAAGQALGAMTKNKDGSSGGTLSSQMGNLAKNSANVVAGSLSKVHQGVSPGAAGQGSQGVNPQNMSQGQGQFNQQNPLASQPNPVQPPAGSGPINQGE